MTLKKSTVFGAIFGLLAPPLGLFVGLQISTFWGNVLAFPFVIISKLTSIPLSDFPLYLKLLGWTISVLFWSLLCTQLSTLKINKK